MKKLYNYLFWYNHHTNLWYAYHKEDYTNFANGEQTIYPSFKNSSIDVLIELIKKI